MDNEVQSNWEQNWKDILVLPDGSIDVEQLKKELHDFSRMMDTIPLVYEHITGGKLSKCLYDAQTVISCADEHYEQLYRLKPDPDLDFEDGDKVFSETMNDDGIAEYFILNYVPEVCSWMLMEFKDKTFSTPDVYRSGKKKGQPIVHYVYEIGLDLLERVADYKYEDLP